MSLLDALSVVTKTPEDGPPWPHAGQQFEVFAAAIPDMEDGVDLVQLVEPATEVRSVMCEFGSGVTSDLFDKLPEQPGLWKMKIEFYSYDDTDWESGHVESDYGFNVLSMEKL